MFLKKSRQQHGQERAKEPKFDWLMNNDDDLTLDEVADIESLLEDDE